MLKGGVAQTRAFTLVREIVHGILARDDVPILPTTGLGEIEGWSTNSTVATVLALEKSLGRTFGVGAVDQLTNLSDLVALVANGEGRAAPISNVRSASYAGPVGRFETLGETCEFGVVQQELGLMHPHLLRSASFQGAPALHLTKLIAALEDDFERIAEPALLDVMLPESEWLGAEKEYRVVNRHYGLQIHTGLVASQIDIDEARRRLSGFSHNLVFLRDKLRYDLAQGCKCWIWKSLHSPNVEELSALLTVLQKHGPNRLLWVVRADADHPPGSVVRLRDNLLQGYIWKSDDPWSGDWSDANAWRTLLESVDKFLPSAVKPRPKPAWGMKPAVSETETMFGDVALGLLTDVVRDQLGNPRLVLRPDMSAADVYGWDSLKHVEIVLELEKRLGRTFGQHELADLHDVGDFVRLILVA